MAIDQDVWQVMVKTFDRKNQRILEILDFKDEKLAMMKFALKVQDKDDKEISEWVGFITILSLTEDSYLTNVARIRWHRVVEMAFRTRHEWEESKGMMRCRHCDELQGWKNRTEQCGKHPGNNPLVPPDQDEDLLNEGVA